MNESISRAAGGNHGQEIIPQDLVGYIHDAGLQAVQRSAILQWDSSITHANQMTRNSWFFHRKKLPGLERADEQFSHHIVSRGCWWCEGG
ncbi:hypothetical protein P4S72_08050 [Vibrio sp. PP-XX7]